MMEDRYSVLITLSSRLAANGFYCSHNGKRFRPPEVEVCHLYFLQSAKWFEYAEEANAVPPGYVELPTCPVCLERLDHDTSGIQNTLCDHSFQCPCVLKWTYLSCQVCRRFQQQDERPSCAVCGTFKNLWACLICSFVGCGRYEEGHALRHWQDTQHCYSVGLEKQQVWDYNNESYVHRLLQSKVDGKAVMKNSSCISHKDECGTCGFSEDSSFGGAILDSKVEVVCRRFQQQDERPSCAVCGTFKNLWACLICSFVGCGRYEEGHALRHWQDTQHCYSVGLEKQQVWDYNNESYVHRLLQSKVDGKAVMKNSSCISHKDECGTCGFSEDSSFGGAILDSKVEVVCRRFQQQDERPSCAVCGTFKNLWACLICSFVGCGRYEEGHALRHWQDTQHCYSVGLEKQQVWDYNNESYVHRLLQSKVDGKAVMKNSSCISHKHECGTCGFSEDSSFGGAILDSKVEVVCRRFQQQDERPSCAVCGTFKNLWACLICSFVGCGRYEEGHALRHWQDTQHCYSVGLEKQQVWDYNNESYVHRLLQSKVDGKAVMKNSSCISHKDECGTCGFSEDSSFGGAILDSKVEVVCRRFQQQDERPSCAVCGTFKNLWACLICSFVGCGRYEEGHALRHWQDTQHCYSVGLEKQQVWDYNNESYVHRLLQSKVDGKAVMKNSSCISQKDECGTCGFNEDSSFGGAILDSIVEVIVDEYNHLLATQMETQRQHYESLLIEAKSRKEGVVSEEVEKAVSLKMEDLRSKLEQCGNEKTAVANVSSTVANPTGEKMKRDVDGAINDEIRANQFCTQGVRCNVTETVTVVPLITSTPGETQTQRNANPKSSWKDILTGEENSIRASARSDLKLKYYPHVPGTPVIDLIPDEDVLLRLNKSLVGHFLGAKLPFYDVKEEIFAQWANSGLKNVQCTDNGFYIFEFEGENSMDEILEKGHCHVFGRLMVIKRWHQMLKLSKEAMDKIPIWIRLYDLPYEFWSADNISKVASRIGTPLYVDQATEKMMRLSYARVCVEINAQSDLKNSISFKYGDEVLEVLVKYQWVPPRCDACKSFGHKLSSCPLQPKPAHPKIGVNETREVRSELPKDNTRSAIDRLYDLQKTDYLTPITELQHGDEVGDCNKSGRPCSYDQIKESPGFGLETFSDGEGKSGESGHKG